MSVKLFVSHIKGRTLLGVFQNRAPRRIFVSKREHVAEDGENGIAMNLIIYTSHKILLDLPNRRMDEQCMTHK